MAVWLALSGGLFYGFGDFSGGVATRRLPVWAVVSWSQAFGLSVLALGLALFPATEVTGADLAWGALAGIGGAVGLGLLYRALADGTMAIISPITAATAAAIPVLVDLAGGGRFTNRGAAGILLALAAIVAIAAERSAGHLSGRLLTTALIAGVGFAVFFIAISRTAEASGFWPLVAARGVTIPIAFALHRAVEPRRVMTAAALPTVAAAGLFDMGANLFIAAALQRGPLGIVVVLGSLYPAVTALAAVILLHERLSRIQLGGVALALGAVGLLVG